MLELDIAHSTALLSLQMALELFGWPSTADLMHGLTEEQSCYKMRGKRENWKGIRGGNKRAENISDLHNT